MGKYTTTGLWEGEGTIVGASFGVKPDYNPTAHLLLLDIETDDANFTEPFQESWSVGDRWVSNDGGETIADPAKPDRKKVNASSQYGRFVERAAQLSGGDGGEVDKRLDPGQNNNVDTTNASVWKGLKFKFERETQTRNIRGQDVVSEKLMPTAFLGVAGTPSSAPATAQASANGLSEAAQAELKVIAMAAANHNEFIDKAMGAQCVEQDRNLVREIAKPELYESLKAG